MELDIASSESIDDQIKSLLLESPLDQPVPFVCSEFSPGICEDYAFRQTISEEL